MVIINVNPKKRGDNHMKIEKYVELDVRGDLAQGNFK